MSGQVDAVCLRVLPPNRPGGATCACELLFERLTDKVHQWDLLVHTVQSQLSVQRFRNPGRELYPDEFFPGSHAPASCPILTTQYHVRASLAADAPQTTGLRRAVNGAVGVWRRSHRVQLG